jgi:hypothetical protein
MSCKISYMELLNKFLPKSNSYIQQNESEQAFGRSEPASNNERMSSESIPKERGESSVHIPYNDTVVQNTVPAHSYQSPATLENLSEKGCHAAVCSNEHEEHTLTIRDATRLFYEAGVPRTERAITKWCSPNAHGLTRLDCCYNETDRKFYITSMSINQAIRNERRRFQALEFKGSPSLDELGSDGQGSEQSRNGMQAGSESISGIKGRGSENVLKSSGHPLQQAQNQEGLDSGRKLYGALDAGQQGEQVRELQMENYNLKVQLEGQKYLVKKFDELVAGERERHESEKIALVDRLMDDRREIGVLEEKLLQLEAPKGAVRETEVLNEVG